jgi:hypothetical protein
MQHECFITDHNPRNLKASVLEYCIYRSQKKKKEKNKWTEWNVSGRKKPTKRYPNFPWSSEDVNRP